MDILDKLNIKYWYKFLTILGVILYIIDRNILWLGVALFGVGEWSAWEETSEVRIWNGVVINSTGVMVRKNKYKFHCIFLRVIGISVIVISLIPPTNLR